MISLCTQCDCLFFKFVSITCRPPFSFCHTFASLTTATGVLLFLFCQFPCNKSLYGCKYVFIDPDEEEIERRKRLMLINILVLVNMINGVLLEVITI